VNPQVAAVKGIGDRHTLLNTSLGPAGEAGATDRAAKGSSKDSPKGSPKGRHLPPNMARSDSVFTTWSKLNGTKTSHPLDTQQLSRHPSGNNNTRIEGTFNLSIQSESKPILAELRFGKKKRVSKLKFFRYFLNSCLSSLQLLSLTRMKILEIFLLPFTFAALVAFLFVLSIFLVITLDFDFCDIPLEVSVYPILLCQKKRDMGLCIKTLNSVEKTSEKVS